MRGARTMPLPVVNADVVLMNAQRFLNVDVVNGTAVLAVDGGTSNGISTGNMGVDVGSPISVFPVTDKSRTFLIECGGTIAKGNDVSADSTGRAVTDGTTGVMTALEAGVVNQVITVISKGAF